MLYLLTAFSWWIWGLELCTDFQVVDFIVQVPARVPTLPPQQLPSAGKENPWRIDKQ